MPIDRRSQGNNLKTAYRHREIPLTKRLRQLLEEVLSNHNGEHVFTMEDGKIFNGDKFRKIWMKASKTSGVQYRKPYTTRHTFAAWCLALRMDPNRLVDLMGHGTKKMIYEDYGKYVKGLEKDHDAFLNYFGEDFI